MAKAGEAVISLFTIYLHAAWRCLIEASIKPTTLRPSRASIRLKYLVWWMSPIFKLMISIICRAIAKGIELSRLRLRLTRSPVVDEVLASSLFVLDEERSDDMIRLEKEAYRDRARLRCKTDRRPRIGFIQQTRVRHGSILSRGPYYLK